MKTHIPLHLALANGMDTFLTRLQRRRSRIEASRKIAVRDGQGREMLVFYMVIDAPHSNQSDESGDGYSIELVTYKGRRVHLTSGGEQALLEYLNCTNPAKLKFT